MTGYTTIQINGQTVGLKFAYPAIKWFTEQCLKPGVAEMFFVQSEKPEEGGFTIEGLSKIIECSYKNNCLIKEVEPTLKFEDFYNYVEISQETPEGLAELTRVTQVYAESSVMKRLIETQKKSQASL